MLECFVPVKQQSCRGWPVRRWSCQTPSGCSPIPRHTLKPSSPSSPSSPLSPPETPCSQCASHHHNTGIAPIAGEKPRNGWAPAFPVGYKAPAAVQRIRPLPHVVRQSSLQTAHIRGHRIPVPCRKFAEWPPETSWRPRPAVRRMPYRGHVNNGYIESRGLTGRAGVKVAKLVSTASRQPGSFLPLKV